jgi:hypothetical protein
MSSVIALVPANVGHQHGDHGGVGNQLVKQLQALSFQRSAELAHAREVAAGSVEAGHQAELDRVDATREEPASCRAAVAHNSATQAWPTETRLRGWACESLAGALDEPAGLQHLFWGDRAGWFTQNFWSVGVLSDSLGSISVMPYGVGVRAT